MLKLKTPILHENETYDIALIYLTCAPVIRGNDFTTAVNLQVVPARQTDDTIIPLHSHSIPAVLSSDAKGGQLSEAMVEGYGVVETVIQGALRGLNIIE